MADSNVCYELIAHICDLTTREDGWRKELNIVAWNGGKPSYDIREWSPAHSQMTRGVRLSDDEMGRLMKGMLDYYAERSNL